MARGNDLVTPQPQWMFPGLEPGDRWCVVAARWAEAHEAGVAPPVVLEATHASALEFASLADLEAHAFASSCLTQREASCYGEVVAAASRRFRQNRSIPW